VDEVNWDRTVFTLICPDAVARHRGFAVLERIESAGFTPVAWRMIWHRPADLDWFHERNITQVWKAYRYRLVDQLFALGPCVAMLVTDQYGTGSHERLRQAKGASDPVLSGPGTIRGDLGSINAMLSLMHCSDSGADSARESAIFAGPGGFAHGGDPGELRTILRLLEVSRPREDRGYHAVLAGLRTKVLAGAWDDLPRPVLKTVGAMLEAGVAELTAQGNGARLAALLPEAHPLATLLEADFTPHSPGPDPRRVAALLALFGTGIDEWESLVLATSRQFTPRGLDHT